MANEVSSLRQAFNRVDIVGRLEEKNLEKKVSEKEYRPACLSFLI